MTRIAAILLAWVLAVNIARAGELDDCRQLIVSIAPTWDSNTGALQRFERDGNEWRAVGAPWPVLFGKNGLAWGIGEKGQEQAGAKVCLRSGDDESG